MSDEESDGGEEEEVISLDEVQREFHKQVGHKPHSVQQLLAFCKQNNYPHKFKDINQWWPTRPDPAVKPKQAPINADDYRTEEEKLAGDKKADKAGDAAQDNEEKDAADDDAADKGGDDDDEEAAGAAAGDDDADKENEAEKEENNDDGGGDGGDGAGDEEEEEEEEEEDEDEED